MYKIFFKDRVIFLTNKIDSVLTPEFSAIHKLGSEGELRKFIRNFEHNKDRKEAYIYHHNEHELFLRFKKNFKNIPAAGGLVWDPKKEHFLGMARRGQNDLPKGKLEPGETFEDAAIREVEEECNIDNLKILNPITSTFHTYYIKNIPVLKETKWFEMIYYGQKKPTPQQEEDITEVNWVNLDQTEQFTNNTYPSIKEIFNLIKKDL
ncbi:NUDIX hydrolase [Thermophagus sp. OGC60D27]|uniref:NUDIX hydrolase n=1 Tax=Thermophagus sp. OGC60D27 TaxID=3458415 RepID=UPI0040384BDB